MSISRFSALTAALIGSTLALSSTLISKPAFAQTDNANLDVSATVTANCTITATPVAFGNYNSSSGLNLLGQSTISVNCTNGTTAQVLLNSGQNQPNANAVERRMVNPGGFFLNYLISKPDGGGRWGEVPSERVSVTGTGSNVALTALFALPSGQAVPPGNYNDNVFVTVQF